MNALHCCIAGFEQVLAPLDEVTYRRVYALLRVHIEDDWNYATLGGHVHDRLQQMLTGVRYVNHPEFLAYLTPFQTLAVCST
jgi:hypothetical protein